jgi:hypothetical protein
MRWKIENEGFNVQKKGCFGLEHAYTNHPNSAKVFYFLLQIAHLLAQLLYKANLLKRDFPDGTRSRISHTIIHIPVACQTSLIVFGIQGTCQRNKENFDIMPFIFFATEFAWAGSRLARRNSGLGKPLP